MVGEARFGFYELKVMAGKSYNFINTNDRYKYTWNYNFYCMQIH
jgi:hypothetical protein